MKLVYSTGGREKYFKTENVGDCVTRAIVNATGKDYKEVYDRLKELEKTLKVGKHEKKGSVRDGTRLKVAKYYIEKELGWIHHSTMKYQQGVSMHLTEEEIPMGNLIVDLSHHLTNVKDKVLYDTYDCSKKTYWDWQTQQYITNNKRAVYNYWTAPTKEDLDMRAETEKLIQLEKEAIIQTKKKVEEIKLKYKPSLTKLEKKLKEIKHQIVIEKNRMNKEIKKVKEQDGNDFCNKLLEA